MSVNAKRLSYLLTAVSAPIVLLGLADSSHLVGYYGVTTSFSWLFYVGVTLTLVAAITFCYCQRKLSAFSLLQVLLFEAYLWLIPIYWFPGLIFPASGHDLFFFTDSAAIMQSGHIDTQLYPYQSFPVPYVLVAILLTILKSVSYLNLWRIIPFFFNILVSALLYIFFQSYLPKSHSNMAVIGVLIFEMFNFTEQLTSVAPFAIGTVMQYFFLFGLVSMAPKFVQWFTKEKNIIYGVMVGTGAALSHPPITVIAIFAVAALSLFDSKRQGVTSVRAIAIPLLVLLVICGWSFSPQTTSFWAGNEGIIRSFTDFFGKLFVGTTQSFRSVPTSHLLINDVRLAVFLGLVALAMPSFLGTIRKRDKRFFGLVVLSAGLALGAPFEAVAQGNNINTYLFSVALPIIIFYDLLTLTQINKKVLFTIMILILTIGSPASFLILYGNVAAESPLSGVITASEYYSLFTPSASNQGGYVIADFVTIGYYGSNLGSLTPFTNTIYPLSFAPANLTASVNYIALGSTAKLASAFVTGNDVFYNSMQSLVQASPNWGLIYSSGFITLFRRIQ